ncbi:uncharacterized protein LOC133301702 [Gastrolobium bilobum]|uniref:uncharacterized protein LOC133301702 n=1 Tax=Gastrolobium bilobum TaxID=150636 RepID=UPI002AB0AD66|nr:uncharacterized protein LOC133301702 [Gastrolobium bilobum]
MDFHTLSRKELQTLCKKNKIPANITNLAMAEALAALPQVEGLDEILNPTEAEGVVEEENKDANVPVTPAMVQRSRRRVPAVSTRRKKETEMLEDEGKPKTPAAAPSSRRRVTGRSVCTKTETPGGTTSVQQGYSTRRSVRLLGKNLSKMGLMDKIDNVSEELSNVSQQEEDSAETEKGDSLQTVSTVVSENTDEMEVSSQENNTGYQCQPHDSGSEVQLVSGTENDAEAGLEIEPQEEGLGKVNYLEAESHGSNLKMEESSDAYDDSNEAGSKLLSELVDTFDSSEQEYKECLGTKQDALSVEESEDAVKAFTDQDIAGLTVEMSEDVVVEVTVQDTAPVTVVVPDDASMDVTDQGVACSLQNFEPINGGDEKAAADKDLASSEGVLELGEHHEEELELEAKSEQLEDEEEMEKIDNASDVTGASSAIITVEKDDGSEMVCMEAENFTFESSLMDVDVNKEEDQKDNSEKLEAEVQAEELAEDTASSAETCNQTIQSLVSDQLNGESLVPAQLETKDDANEIQTVPKMIMKENLTGNELQKNSVRQLKKMLKLRLDGKSNCNTDDVVKEVERKRTALQALPENRMTMDEAQKNDAE